VDDPWLRDAVIALAESDGMLVAATRDRVGWRDAGGVWTVERSLGGEVGRIIALASDAEGVWIAGTSGVVRFQPGRGTFPLALRRDDLPGEPWDVAVDERFLWIATDRGVVRFETRVLPR
jgi:ligand-binding sensor domain-containing protein